MGKDQKPGVLLVNLGTPDAPRTPEVRRYLKEFLSDPKVVDINPIGRWLLVNFIIAPFRSPKSAAAYQQIWTQEGSPLLTNSRALASAVASKLSGTPVELAMRYGKPSLASGLAKLVAQGCDEITVFPLYPQFADSSTGSSIEKVREEAKALASPPNLRFVDPFYDAPAFIDAFASVGRPTLEAEQPDHVLFSFHGLPERHVTATDLTGKHCLQAETCCAAVGEANANCYRAHCFATARSLAAALALPDDGWTVSFQSRLGRAEWIKPDTTSTIQELARSGTKNLAVFCPAFVADCLETLEEIAIREAKSFREAGGERLHLVPSLNAHPRWVDAVVELIGQAEPSPRL